MKEIIVKGYWKQDDNFVHIYADNNRIYEIARGTGEWGSRAVGEYAAYGGQIKQEDFDEAAARCDKIGEFALQYENYDHYGNGYRRLSKEAAQTADNSGNDLDNNNDYEDEYDFDM